MRTFIQRCNYYLNISEARDREKQENKEGIKADVHGSKANSTRDQLEDRKKELSKQVDDLNKSLKTADENEKPKIEKKIRDLNKEISKIDNTIKKNTTETDEERYQDHRAVQDHLSGTSKKENENNNDEDQEDQTDDNDTNDSDQQTNSNKGKGQQENVKNQDQNSNQGSKNDQETSKKENTNNKNIKQTPLNGGNELYIDKDTFDRLNNEGQSLYGKIVAGEKNYISANKKGDRSKAKKIRLKLDSLYDELKNNTDKYTNPKKSTAKQESFDWFDDEEEPFSSLFLFDD